MSEYVYGDGDYQARLRHFEKAKRELNKRNLPPEKWEEEIQKLIDLYRV